MGGIGGEPAAERGPMPRTSSSSKPDLQSGGEGGGAGGGGGGSSGYSYFNEAEADEVVAVVSGLLRASNRRWAMSMTFNTAHLMSCLIY